MAPSDKPGKNRPRSSQKGKTSRLFDDVLSLPVTVVRNGRRHTVSAERALLIDIRHKAREKDAAAAELLADAFDAVTEMHLADAIKHRPMTIRRIMVRPGSVSRQLEYLRMAKKFDRTSSRSYKRLEPWLVQAALARLGEQRLTIEQQRTVYAATRTPAKVRWPDWWEIKS